MTVDYCDKNQCLMIFVIIIQNLTCPLWKNTNKHSVKKRKFDKWINTHARLSHNFGSIKTSTQREKEMTIEKCRIFLCVCKTPENYPAELNIQMTYVIWSALPPPVWCHWFDDRILKSRKKFQIESENFFQSFSPKNVSTRNKISMFVIDLYAKRIYLVCLGFIIIIIILVMISCTSRLKKTDEKFWSGFF